MSQITNITVINFSSTSSQIRVNYNNTGNVKSLLYYFTSSEIINNTVPLNYLYSTSSGVEIPWQTYDVIHSGSVTLPDPDYLHPSSQNRYLVFDIGQNLILNNLPENTLIFLEIGLLDFSNNVINTSTYQFTSSVLGPGAGSDPYITTLSGYKFELPHLNKWWSLFEDKETNFKILGHTHNYKSGNLFNKIIIFNNKNKATIDFQTKKIIIKNNDESIIIKNGYFKINYDTKDRGIITEPKKYDYIELNHPEFKNFKAIINWRNRYIHPIFERLPNKTYSGLMTLKKNSKVSLV